MLNLRNQVIPVYASSHADQMHDPWFSPEKFWDRLVDIYAKTRDFDLVTAWLDGVVVGYAFGSPRDNPGLWPDLRKVFHDMTPEEPVYIFREFAVTPALQRHGIGTKIHNELLRPRTEQVAHLLVRPDNDAAQAAYRRWGWKAVGQVQPFADSPIFDALALDLRSLDRGHRP
jgi:ribosomal protein S18 acetylase RimI-like enzyme